MKTHKISKSISLSKNSKKKKKRETEIPIWQVRRWLVRELRRQTGGRLKAGSGNNCSQPHWNPSIGILYVASHPHAVRPSTRVCILTGTCTHSRVLVLTVKISRGKYYCDITRNIPSTFRGTVTHPFFTSRIPMTLRKEWTGASPCRTVHRTLSRDEGLRESPQAVQTLWS